MTILASDGFEYEVKIRLHLTRREIERIIELGVKHYDGVCKASCLSGGFVYGWAYRDWEIGKHGKLVKHKATDDPVITPYAAISDMYYKQMITADRRIWEIVKDNSQHKFSQGDMHGSVMEGLISRGK